MRQTLIKNYRLATIFTLLLVLLAVIYDGISAILPIAALAFIEVSFSFDNAVVNSRVLAKMSSFWRTIYLTLGFAVAVLGVRLALPILLVALAGGLGFGDVLQMAVHNPSAYSEELDAVYPIIAAFGGMFLLMVGLKFFTEKHKTQWIRGIETRAHALANPWIMPISACVIALLSIKYVLGITDSRVMYAAAFGLVIYILLSVATRFLLRTSARAHRTGLVMFLYLEVLDASFSLDSVIAAFSITKDLFLIVAGLGIGAIYLRSMTLHLVGSGTLANYRYLVFGAHYAIVVLAILLLISIKHELPDMLSGILSLGIIGAAFVSSRNENNKAKT